MSGDDGGYVPQYLPKPAPVTNKNSSERRRPSSRDYGEQIRQLEKEGRKLMDASNTLVDSLGAFVGGHTTAGMSTTGYGAVRTSPGSLSALADITQETKTISEMRANLDAQKQETDKLQRSLRGESYGTYQPSATMFLSNLDIPEATSAYVPEARYTSHTPLPGYRSADYLGTSHLEQELRASREEVNDVKNKLREAIRLSEQQKNQYRQLIEDLKLQVAQVQRQRDQITEARQKEQYNYENNISHQKTSIKQLEDANRVQEETLLEMSSKMEVLQRDTHISDTLMAQIRSLLLDRERKRGQPFYEAQNVSTQSTTLLAHSLERCFQELETEAETANRNLEQMQNDQETLQFSSTEKLQRMSKEHQARLAEISESHSRELSAAVERSGHARKQVVHLQEQLDLAQQQKRKKYRLRLCVDTTA